MIISFSSKETKQIWNGIRVKKMSLEIQNIGRRKLRMLNNSNDILDLRIPPSNRLEKLTGKLNNFYSIRINKQCRIIFIWDKENVDKVFMPSKAKTTKANLVKYKVIKKGEFAYSAMQVGRDETVRVVLYSYDEPAIISPAYHVFKVNDEKEILPEFLMLWFYRPEFNRFGWFISDSSVRASLEWDRFHEIEIPVPDIEVQKAIVTIYHTLETRKRINAQLKDSIKPLCPVLMRGVVEEIKVKKLEY